MSSWFSSYDLSFTWTHSYLLQAKPFLNGTRTYIIQIFNDLSFSYFIDHTCELQEHENKRVVVEKQVPKFYLLKFPLLMDDLCNLSTLRKDHQLGVNVAYLALVLKEIMALQIYLKPVGNVFRLFWKKIEGGSVFQKQSNRRKERGWRGSKMHYEYNGFLNL